MRRLHWLCVVWLAAGTACQQERGAEEPGAQEQVPPDAELSCDADARRVAEGFGERLRMVSVLAPDTVLRRSLAEAYAPFVTRDLLESWQANLSSAPGRDVSTPWPARIVIREARVDGEACVFEGDVEYVTAADTVSVLDLRPVTVRMARGDEWRVAGFELGGEDPMDEPARVVERYYDAINRRDFRTAYLMWSDSGRASGQTFEAFEAGFAETEGVEVTVADDVEVEGAAGSQFATVSVRIAAVLRGGDEQRFAGTYTVRRAMVDGATPEQRAWHIFSADIATPSSEP